MKHRLLTLILCLFFLNTFSQIANPPSQIEICDDNEDGFAVFDLTINDQVILGILDPSTLTITYHETLADAESGMNPIVGPYTNTSNPQTLYARVFEFSTGNYETYAFDIIVNPLPSVTIDDVSICQGNSTVIDTGLGGSQFSFLWSYDGFVLQSETNPFLEVTQEGPYSVQVFDNITGCSAFESFNVSFDGTLNYNQPNTLFSCNIGNGFGEFDLETMTSEITNGLTGLTVTYHETQADADAATNAINTEFSYTNIVPFVQLLYIRIEDNNSSCFALAVVELIVTGADPLIDITDFVVCDTDMDGLTEFNLNEKDQEVLTNQSSWELIVTYHLTELDALNLTNPLSSPFTNFSNPQTIYVAVTDFNFCSVQTSSFNLVADQTCMPCQEITPTVDTTTPEVNDSGIVVVQAGDTVSFNGSATFSNDGTNATYNWNFGDGSSVSGAAVTHDYTQEGSYTVTFTVTDDNPEGCTASTNLEVLVVGENLIVDQSQFTVEELVQNVLIGNECSQISNITYSTGSIAGQEPNGIGYFVYAGSDFPFSEGLLISTGSAADAEGPNDELASSGTNNWPGDNDLDTTLGINSNNATSIEFDFVPVVNQINFDFLMASEEYNGGQFECQFSDAFAFLLTDAMGNTTNLALIPGTDLPITVTNIHNANDNCDAANPEFFGGYTAANAPPTNFNGRTVSFTAQANVNIGETYHIKLVVADDSDALYDTAVFFKAGSFDVGSICDDVGLISMNAFNDTNANGSFDNSETNFTNGSFTYEKNNDGIINVVNSSNGSFTILSDNESDTYDITYQINDDYTNCYTLTTTAFDDVSVSFGEVAQVNFPVVDNLTCEDLGVYLVNPFASPRPGFEHTNLLIIQNLSGPTIASGSVEFTVDDDLVINDTALSNTDMSITNTANGFTLNFTNLVAGESRVVDITLFCPVSVPLGEIVTNIAEYTTASNDLVSENNISTLSEIVIGSYDPNDKMESHGPEIVYDDFVTTDEYLYYTIRFQNVGTAEAIFVRIEDELDVQLDETTFQMLRASHDYTVTRTGTSLEWFFDDINLPAEQDDADGSNGFVYFKIKPKAGYAVNDVIPNSASIYFDFNAPIITNTYNTTFIEPLSVNDFNGADVSLYPNPANTKVTIALNGKSVNDLEVSLIDIQGKIISTPQVVRDDLLELDVSSLNSGLYFVQLKNDSRIVIEKLIIE
ncbi:choice-of-anchor L domain-containing protein [uncultured Winogradskyella sp.]|uniref:DUF7619 domain-containing protein n=1 Tax=uncultured Winogradskyella sp. TaxID=395353 RepID=UPI00260E1288|nr:choice-of-anchor L domain-containing protein [uncultured Winogradskyella sp.]